MAVAFAALRPPFRPTAPNSAAEVSFQEIRVETSLFCTDTSIDSEKGKPVVRRGRKATGPSGSAGPSNEGETKMKGKRRNLGEGMRWLMVAALPSGVRAGGDAVDWLLD